MGGSQTVLESYSFTFEYHHGILSSIQLSPTNHTFVFGNLRRSFKGAIRALLRSLRDLPRLPGSTTLHYHYAVMLLTRH